MATESDTMAVLASVLADPAAAAQRLKDLNAARTAAEFAQTELATKLKEIQKIEADANATYKKASEERVAAARELKDAEEKRKATQLLLDKIGIRESEVSAREERAAHHADALSKDADDLALRTRKLEERAATLASAEKQTLSLQTELMRKLKAIKDIAA